MTKYSDSTILLQAEHTVTMSGTSSGAKKASETKRKKYGNDFFIEAGQAGGLARNKSPNRFTPFADKEFAKKMSKLGVKKRWGK